MATITVDLNQSPALYSTTHPAGAEVLGVVVRDGFERGVLARIPTTGLYVQINAGVVRSLPQRATAAALAAALASPGGAAALMGRRGGSARSEAKGQAARDNGRKGGRPRKP